MYEVRDIKLAPSGEQKIQWAKKNMPLLAELEKAFEIEQPFKGLKIALSVHIEAKTANLCRLLVAGGAQMYATGCNPLSTQDDIAAAVAEGGINIFAWHGATPEEYERHLRLVLEAGPNIIIDDGGDLASLMHTEYKSLLKDVIGGCEETTTGISRLKIMEKENMLKYPIVMVNNAKCKYLFDNRYGTGQSVWDGINRTTNLIVAGKNVVIAGYGWCGKGIAMRAKGFGAKVIVTEIDPVKALEAAMDGFEVMQMRDAAPIGDIFITVTGCSDVISKDIFPKMKSGAILCNAGHFNVEVDVDTLEEIASEITEQRKNVKGYKLENGNWLYVLAEGRLVNLASGDGHPVEIMDMSFAIQALSARYLALNKGKFSNVLMDVPEEIDREIAYKKLSNLGISIDALTKKQQEYMQSWEM